MDQVHVTASVWKVGRNGLSLTKALELLQLFTVPTDALNNIISQIIE
jgi:hypothetical protein